jgi:hypothetical protein
MDQFLQWFDRGGVAVVLVAFGMVFFTVKVWPYITRRQDRLDAEDKKRKDDHDAEEKFRHAEYMKVIGNFAAALNAVNTTTNALGQLIGNMTNKMDDHHEQVMAELRRK